MIVGSSIDLNQDLLEAMRHHATLFVLKLESISRHHFQVFDVDFSVSYPSVDALGSLSYRLFTKPSSIWTPLSSESHHPESIRRPWPKARVRKDSE